MRVSLPFLLFCWWRFCRSAYLVFHFQNSFIFCFLSCFYLLFQILSNFIHLFQVLYFSYAILTSFFKWIILLLQLLFVIFFDFFKGFIYYFFRNLYHLYTIVLKVIFFYFTWVGIFRACCNRRVGLRSWYTAFISLGSYAAI